MRKNLLTIGLMLAGFAGANAQTPWVMQYSGFSRPASYPFTMSCVDANTLWAGAEMGDGTNQSTQEFTHTIDGGLLWTAGSVMTDTNYRWSCIAGIDTSTAYAMFYNSTVGTGGGIWKTTDGGTSWNQLGVGLIFDANSFPDIVHFYDVNNGVAMGDPNGGYFEIYTTADAGATWVRTPQADIPAPLAGEYGIINDFCVHDSILWFGTNKGRVYKSSDKGLTWTVAAADLTSRTIGDVAFIDANNGIGYSVTTTQFFMVKTTDGGTTWSNVAYTGLAYRGDVEAIPGTNVYMSVGASGTGGLTRGSSYSQTDGSTWILLDSASIGASVDGYTSIAFYNSQIGWAGGFSADPLTDGMYKWASAPLAVNNISGKPVSGFNAYPNPSTNFINVELKNKNKGNVKVEIVNVTGAVVLTKTFNHASVLFNEKIDLSSIEKGAYLIKVTSNGDTSVQKLILN